MLEHVKLIHGVLAADKKDLAEALKCVDDEGTAFKRYVDFHPITNVTFVQNVAISILKEDKEWEM